jgi:hypothetical protein
MHSHGDLSNVLVIGTGDGLDPDQCGDHGNKRQKAPTVAVLGRLPPVKLFAVAPSIDGHARLGPGGSSGPRVIRTQLLHSEFALQSKQKLRTHPPPFGSTGRGARWSRGAVAQQLKETAAREKRAAFFLFAIFGIKFPTQRGSSRSRDDPEGHVLANALRAGGHVQPVLARANPGDGSCR